MSHPQSARILEFLGFVPDKDYIVVGNAESATITWLSQQAQPTDAAIDAAAADAQAEFEARAADAARRDQAKQAYDTLTNIRNGAQTVIDDPSVSNAEAVTYIKQLANAVQTLAQVEQHLIRALFGR